MSKVKTETMTISEPNFKTIQVRIVGDAPLVQQAFSQKAREQMAANMKAGSTAKKGKKRDPRDFDEDFRQAQHLSTEGWNGVPASAFRNACIDACRMVGFQMTRAKMSIFILADGFDAVDGSPLVRIDAPPPERLEMATRNHSGVPDIRVRPMWRKWEIDLRVRFDADQFTAQDVLNLMTRAGAQVGIGEGRPFSKMSNGLGYGTFFVKGVI